MSEKLLENLREAIKEFIEELKNLEPLFTALIKSPKGKIAWDCFDVLWYRKRKNQIKKYWQAEKLDLLE